MLTKKQHQLLLFIRDRLARDGVAPSFDEMKEALDLQSKSGIHRLIMALEERGFLRRLPHRARALEVIKLPENMPAPRPHSDRAPDRTGFTPNVITGNFSGAMPGASVKAGQGAETIDLPLYGKIAAGTPIEALRNPTEHVGVPGGMLGSGDHYALTIDGDSMIDAGIFDRDYVVVRQQPTAENGDIVVAGIPGEEATVKTYLHKKGQIILRPSNPALEDMVFAPNEISIYGKVVTVMRRL